RDVSANDDIQLETTHGRRRRPDGLPGPVRLWPVEYHQYVLGAGVETGPLFFLPWRFERGLGLTVPLFPFFSGARDWLVQIHHRRGASRNATSSVISSAVLMIH